MDVQAYSKLWRLVMGCTSLALCLLQPSLSMAAPVALPSAEHGHFGGLTPTILLDLNAGTTSDAVPFTSANFSPLPPKGSCSIPSIDGTRETCNFTDSVQELTHFLHWEVAIQNANEVPIVMNVNLTSLGQTIVQGVLSLGVTSTALFEVFVREPAERGLWSWTAQVSTASLRITVDTAVVEYIGVNRPAHEVAYGDRPGNELVPPNLFLDGRNPTFFSDPLHDCFAPRDAMGNIDPVLSCPDLARLNPDFVDDLLDLQLPTLSSDTVFVSAIPEPSTILLMISGLLGLGVQQWYKRRHEKQQG